MQNRIIARLKNHRCTLPELSSQYRVSEDWLRSLFSELSSAGIRFETRQNPGGVSYHINAQPDVGNTFFISGADKVRREMNFGYCSDLHFASKHHLNKQFHESMRYLEDSGIKRVYVSGDILDGFGIYHGHLENLVATTVEDQTDIAAAALGKHPDLEFWAIAGNHDYSFTKQNGVRPLKLLEQKIDNFKNLGDLRADVVYHGIRIRLLHGAGGRAYARSYPSQTYLRDLFGGSEREAMHNMPHIILLGHYHTLYNSKDHGIWILQPGSFQDPENEYCVRRGLTGPNGCHNITVNYVNGKIKRFRGEYHQP